MFDRQGRVLCDRCEDTMEAIDVEVGNALFQCRNGDCNHTRIIYWDTYPLGDEAATTGIDNQPI